MVSPGAHLPSASRRARRDRRTGTGAGNRPVFLPGATAERHTARAPGQAPAGGKSLSRLSELSSATGPATPPPEARHRARPPCNRNQQCAARGVHSCLAAAAFHDRPGQQHRPAALRALSRHSFRSATVYTPAPTWMHFPHLPAIEFYDRADFAWLVRSRPATADIRQELANLLTSDPSGVEPYVDYPDGSPLNQWKALNRSRQWGAYYLIRSGTPATENLARCPQTAQLLAAAPLAAIPGHAPTAFFSLLEPRTRIPAHTGVTNTRLVCHVPLIVPPGCGFRVGAETRGMEDGRGVGV